MERKVFFDIFDVCLGNEGRLTESAFALAALALQQVAFPLFTTKYLPCASDFEALGDGLTCFCFSSYSWHGARKLLNTTSLARRKWVFLERILVVAMIGGKLMVGWLCSNFILARQIISTI